MNLAVNARDAMPDGGTLTITLDEFQIGPEYLDFHPEARTGHFVRLQITDTGCGMPPDVRARIFEPFFTTKGVGKGTGLGLATVFGIVKQHAGWIEVASEVGRGTTFTVYFPASSETPAPETSPPAAAAPAATGGSETILVVEDEIVLREMARDFLTSCGYQILEAGSGREALQVWWKHRAEIDLLLTDMKMPEGVSGMELAEKMLAEQPGPARHFHQRLLRRHRQHGSARTHQRQVSAQAVFLRRHHADGARITRRQKRRRSFGLGPHQFQNRRHRLVNLHRLHRAVARLDFHFAFGQRFFAECRCGWENRPGRNP